MVQGRYVILLGVLIAAVPVLFSMLSEPSAPEAPSCSCDVSDQRMMDAEQKLLHLEEMMQALRAGRDN